MEGSESETDQTFEVSGSLESALASPENEGVNVCRVAALATMLGGDRQAVRELAPELLALGFSDRLGSGEYSWTDIDSLQRVFLAAEQKRGVSVSGSPRACKVLSLRKCRPSADVRVLEPAAAGAFSEGVEGANTERTAL